MSFVEKFLQFYVKKMPLERGKSRLIEVCHQLTPFDRKVEFVTSFDAKMKLDLSQYISRQIYFKGIYEREVLETMGRLHRVLDFDAMIDVGANIGQHTLYGATVLGLQQIHAFEADSDIFSRLQENILLNGLSNEVTPWNLAVIDKPGQLFKQMPDTDNDGRNFFTETTDTRDAIRIPATSLDDFFRERPFERIVVKVDVEGAEMRVLKGATELLKTGRVGVVFVEICQDHLRRFCDDQCAMLSLLQEMGYVGAAVLDAQLKSLDTRDLPAFCTAVFVRKAIMKENWLAIASY